MDTRGVQYLKGMMQKCIIVEIGENKKTQIKPKNVNFAEIGGICINFVEIGGNMQYPSVAYGGWTPLWMGPMYCAHQYRNGTYGSYFRIYLVL